ncbi:MAG: hypothetical protein LBL05_05370 [Synergistaceae bacterium]|jgi:hypothetical protein|nr:hypothetical protein [Synergistaceae bacterium]
MTNIDEKKRTQANRLKNFSVPVTLILALAVISLTAFCYPAARTDASQLRNVRSGASYAVSTVSADVVSEDERVAQ